MYKQVVLTCNRIPGIYAYNNYKLSLDKTEVETQIMHWQHRSPEDMQSFLSCMIRM